MVKAMIFAAIGGGAAVAVVVLTLFFFNFAAPQYQMSVEAQTGTSMGNMGYTDLKIKNTGTSELTNIKVDYGQTSEKIASLEPGQWVDVAPPASATRATVTCDQNVTVTKEISSMG